MVSYVYLYQFGELVDNICIMRVFLMMNQTIETVYLHTRIHIYYVILLLSNPAARSSWTGGIYVDAFMPEGSYLLRGK